MLKTNDDRTLFWDVGGGRIESIMTGKTVATVHLDNITADEAYNVMNATLDALHQVFAPPKDEAEHRMLPRSAWTFKISHGMLLVCRKHLVSPDGTHAVCWERVSFDGSDPADDLVAQKDLEGLTFRPVERSNV